MIKERNISDQTIRTKTGKTSKEWYQIIDGFNTQNHTQIAKLLREKYHVSSWWAQIITNRYEWKRGLRTS